MLRRFCVYLGLILLASSSSAIQLLAEPSDSSDPSSDAKARCEAIAAVDLSTLPDAPSQIIKAEAIASGDNLPAYCEVSGYVAPSVRFLMRLPSEHWNGKFIERGCGGACGSTDHVVICDDPLRRGYACIVNDGGHPSSGGELLWAYGHPQAAAEYFVHASHAAALAGKAITERFYAAAPTRSYFMGCSAGGIQAMWVARLFPWDFDGVIAGAPCVRLSRTYMSRMWNIRALTGANTKPVLSKADLELLHRAVIAACDMNDGVNDGLIGDPHDCSFDPAQLTCSGGKTDQCLTAEQVEAVKKVYSGPVDSKGEQVAVPIAMKGSELMWSLFVTSTDRPNAPLKNNYFMDSPAYSLFTINLGADGTPQTFDFDHDYKRLGPMEILEPSSHPDLHHFKEAGGKLLAYTGWSDAVEGLMSTIYDHETVEKVMGGRAATQEFFRLFVIPGMSHCAGGEGADDIDYLSYLEKWVEEGQAPDKLIGAHNSSEPRFSRPIYPYPVRTKYLGHGDPKDAASFGPSNP